MRWVSVFCLFLFAVSAHAADTVISLKLDSGGIADGRDTRTFAIPLNVNGRDHLFAWGCSGWTMVSETFARENGLKIDKPTDDMAGYIDAEGNSMFAGVTEATVSLGGQKFPVTMRVLKDAYASGNTVGYEIASRFQWELNPDVEKPTLTLRRLGSKIAGTPVAVLPITDDGERLWLNVNVRNWPFDLVIMPQASDIVAGPSIQKKWDLTKGKVENVPSPAGPVRTAHLREREPVQLAGKETVKSVTIILVGDPESGQDLPANTNAVGASILNRYVYVVDAKAKQMTLLSRRGPTTQPAEK